MTRIRRIGADFTSFLHKLKHTEYKVSPRRGDTGSRQGACIVVILLVVVIPCTVVIPRIPVIPRLTRNPLNNALLLVIRGLRVKPAMTGKLGIKNYQL
jgi:hypothetical protein